MNKISILFFVLVICITVGAENDESQSLAEKSSVRTARFAEAKKKSPVKTKKKGRKGRKGKNAQKEKNRRRGRKGEGGKKQKKRGRANNSSKGKKERKGRKGRNGKKGKNAKKEKNRRRGRKGGKKQKKRGRAKKSGRKNRGNKSGSTTKAPMKNCFKPAMKYMMQMQKIVSNFERQSKRAIKHSDLMYKKNLKTVKFTEVSEKLLAAGGGNKSNLACGGVTGNTGAGTLKTLMTTLAACPATVKASCGNQTWVPLNATILASCTTLIAKFSAAVGKCQDGEDCECWGAADLAAMSGKLSDCGKTNVKDPQAKITKQKDLCTKAFQACRTAEDNSVSAVAACMKSSSDLTATATSLTTNNASATAALTKVKALAKAARSKRSATTVAAMTCADIVTKATTLITLINGSPSDSKIYTVSVEISSSTVTCSATEKTKLGTLAISLETAVATIATALEQVMILLKDLTGSTPSSAGLTTAKATTAAAAATTAKATTAKATTAKATTAKATTAKATTAKATTAKATTAKKTTAKATTAKATTAKATTAKATTAKATTAKATTAATG